MDVVRVVRSGQEAEFHLEKGVSIPEPQNHEVLIKVKAVHVNQERTVNVVEKTISKFEVPEAVVAGIVEKVGSNVTTFKVGDRVHSNDVVVGGVAEFCVANVKSVEHLHDCVSFSQGAAVVFPYHVAYKAMIIKAEAKPGEIVLIHGASEEVGIAATQVAKAHGLVVICTVLNVEEEEIVRKNGADFVVNVGVEDYVPRIKEITGDQGVNILVGTVVNLDFDKDVAVTAVRGRIAVIGSVGVIDKIDPSPIISKEICIVGVNVHISTEEERKICIHGVNAGQVIGWVKPRVVKEYSINEVVQVLNRVIGGRIVGVQGTIIVNMDI